MPRIVRYRKYIDALRTVTLRLPTAPDSHAPLGIELAEIDGETYVTLPDGVELSAQPPEISVAEVTLTPTLREALKAASPHVRLINARVQQRIAERYTIADEIKLLRLGPGPDFDSYHAYVEECRAWGREQKAALGL